MPDIARGCLLSNKINLVILSVQTVLILILLVKFQSLDRTAHRLSQQMTTVPVTQGHADSMDKRPVFSTAPTIDYEVTRRIIREELTALAGTFAQIQNQNLESSTQAAKPVDPRETERLRAQITGQITALSGQGLVSQGDMLKLEASIAKLPPAARKEALADLNRAINSGQIKARF